MKHRFILAAALGLAATTASMAQVPETTITLGNGARLKFLVGYYPQNSGLYLDEATGTDGLDIVIPDQVEYNGVSYPVTSVSAYAFSGEGLYSVVIPNTVENISFGAFEDCTNLVEVTVGSGVTDLAETAFQGCTSLAVLNWNADSCEIEDFDGSGPFGWPNIGLTTLNLGPAVRHIGSGVFEYLEDLETITIEADRLIAATANSFWGSATGVAITVPCQQLAAYQGSSVWNAIGTITADCSNPPSPSDPESHTLTVLANDTTMGTAWGGCTFTGDTTVVIYATPTAGNGFRGWSDGATGNPRTLSLNADSTVTAMFFLPTVCDSVNITDNVNLVDSVVYRYIDSTVTVVDTVTFFDTVTVTVHDTATFFDTVTVTVYDTVTVRIDGAEGRQVNVHVAEGHIVVEGAAAGEAVTLHDATGRRLAHTTATGGQTLLPLPPTGAYVVSVGGRPARKVVVKR